MESHRIWVNIVSFVMFKNTNDTLFLETYMDFGTHIKPIKAERLRTNHVVQLKMISVIITYISTQTRCYFWRQGEMKYSLAKYPYSSIIYNWDVSIGDTEPNNNQGCAVPTTEGFAVGRGEKSWEEVAPSTT